VSNLIGKSLVKSNNKVVKGQVIGYVGNLTTKKGIPSMMLYLEMYSDTTNKGTLSGTNKYHRRADLIDPTPFLDNASL
jgi:murein DD-endopeptidase MepM/ murein hydrolase activator NlpD